MTSLAHPPSRVPAPSTFAAGLSTPRTIVWTTPTPGLWVLDCDRSFGGTIDRLGARFSVTGSRGEPLGRFDTLTAAQQHLLQRTAAPSRVGTAA